MRRVFSVFALTILLATTAISQSKLKWQSMEKITPDAIFVIERASHKTFDHETYDAKEFSHTNRNTVIVRFDSGQLGYYVISQEEAKTKLPENVGGQKPKQEKATNSSEIIATIDTNLEFDELVKKFKELWYSHENTGPDYLTPQELADADALASKLLAISSEDHEKFRDVLDTLGERGNRYKNHLLAQIDRTDPDEVADFYEIYFNGDNNDCMRAEDHPSISDHKNALKDLVQYINSSLDYYLDAGYSSTLIAQIKDISLETYEQLISAGKIR